MRLEMMPLIGISVPDLDAAVREFSALFELEFRVFTSGVDYAVTLAPNPSTDSAPPLPKNVRVDDIDAAAAHFRAQGMTCIQDLRAGIAREVIFDASGLHGIRVCLLQFEGASFAAALEASPSAAAPPS